MLSALRICLLLGVILGVVLPKSSAALAQLGVIDDRVVVICTAHGLQEITLAPDDAPAPSPPEAPCLLVHALDSAPFPPQPVWRRLAAPDHAPPTQDLWRSIDAPSHGFARAPPRG